MKKKILGGIVIFAVAAVAAFNVSLNMNQKGALLSSALIKVEALAQNENGGGTPFCTCEKTCKDGNTKIKCTGYSSCNCHSGTYHIECDGVKAYC